MKSPDVIFGETERATWVPMLVSVNTGTSTLQPITGGVKTNQLLAILESYIYIYIYTMCYTYHLLSPKRTVLSTTQIKTRRFEELFFERRRFIVLLSPTSLSPPLGRRSNGASALLRIEDSVFGRPQNFF